MTNLIALPQGTELVGDYRIDRVLGAGGFGVTYLADEMALGRAVTIKEYFPSDFAARQDGIDAKPRSQDCDGDYKWGLERFIEEAQTLARFDHANIVRVYRYFRANNTGYMVLQFEEGQSLKGWLKGLGRAPRQKELDLIVAPLLDALETIHKTDFLHRDIAPDNIIIRKSGDPVLIDFGSARGEMASNPKTVSALVKPGYSPYEQYAENSKQQGPWTDIYALAATLYHAITGKRPPDAPSRMLKDDIVLARDAALSAYRGRFLDAIDRALKLSIDDRPSSIAAWRGELLAPDDPKPGWLARLRERTAGGPSDSSANSRERKSAKTNATRQTHAIPPPPDVPGAQGQLLDFVDDLQGQSTPQNIAQRLEKVKSAPPAPAPVEAVTPPAKKATAEPSPQPAKAKRASKKKTAQLALAVPKPAARAKLKPVPVAATKRRSAGSFFKTMTAVALAGGLFAAFHDRIPANFLSKPAPAVAGPNTGVAKLTSIRAHQGAAEHVAFSSDGARLVTTGSDGLLKVWNAASQTLQASIPMDDGPATSLSLSDSRAMTSHRDGTVVVWDIDRGIRLSRLKRNDAAIWGAAFANPATLVVTAAHDWSVAIWDQASEAAPLQVLDGHQSAVQAVATDRAGRFMATGSADRTVKLWNMQTRELVRTYRDNSDFVTAVALSPTGETLAAGDLDGRVKVWPTTSTRPQRVFEAHKGRVTGLAFSPGGDVLATVGEDGVAQLRGLKRFRTMITLPMTDGRASALAFSPDGRQLVTASTDGLVTFWALPESRIAQR